MNTINKQRKAQSEALCMNQDRIVVIELFDDFKRLALMIMLSERNNFITPERVFYDQRSSQLKLP